VRRLEHTVDEQQPRTFQVKEKVGGLDANVARLGIGSGIPRDAAKVTSECS
jgi:hypothetical protein